MRPKNRGGVVQGEPSGPLENEESQEIPDYSSDYVVGQDNIQPFGLDIHNPVFVISGSAIVLFVLFTFAFPAWAAENFGDLPKNLVGVFYGCPQQRYSLLAALRATRKKATPKRYYKIRN